MDARDRAAGFPDDGNRVRLCPEAVAVLRGTVLTAMERSYLSSSRLMRWTVPTARRMVIPQRTRRMPHPEDGRGAQNRVAASH